MEDNKWGHFYYDETSPTCLRWAVHIPHSKFYAGDVAGGEKPNGKDKPGVVSLVVCLAGKDYKCHRVIWELHNGAIGDELQIDHIDGNPRNNQLSNLRVVTSTINNRNRKASSRNTTGSVGVCCCKGPKGQDIWVATWKDEDGKNCKKTFSTNKYTNARELAEATRRSELAKLQGYSGRHGT